MLDKYTRIGHLPIRMTQSLLWQESQQSNEFAELCSALYEREVTLLARVEVAQIENLATTFTKPALLCAKGCSCDGQCPDTDDA